MADILDKGKVNTVCKLLREDGENIKKWQDSNFNFKEWLTDYVEHVTDVAGYIEELGKSLTKYLTNKTPEDKGKAFRRCEKVKKAALFISVMIKRMQDTRAKFLMEYDDYDEELDNA